MRPFMGEWRCSTGLDTHRYDLLEKAFIYIKKAITIYKRYTWEERSVPNHIPTLFHEMSKIVIQLTEMNKDCGTACRKEMFQLFDDILTEDEGQLVLDDAIASVEILQEDYHSIFLISKEILGSENSQERIIRQALTPRKQNSQRMKLEGLLHCGLAVPLKKIRCQTHTHRGIRRNIPSLSGSPTAEAWSAEKHRCVGTF